MRVAEPPGRVRVAYFLRSAPRGSSAVPVPMAAPAPPPAVHRVQFDAVDALVEGGRAVVSNIRPRGRVTCHTLKCVWCGVVRCATPMSPGVRNERTLSRDALEAILMSSGLDPDNEIIKSELAGVTQPDGTVVVDTAKRNSVLTKVGCARPIASRMCACSFP